MSKPAVRSFQQIWKHLNNSRRRQVAEAFCASEEYAGEQRRASGIVAAKLNLRPQKALQLPPEKKAAYLASIDSLDEQLSGSIVRAFLFSRHQSMLSMFLDELQLPHKNGVMSEDVVDAPSAEALGRAVDRIRANFDPDAVQLYMAALRASDAEMWVNLAPDEAAATSS